MRIIYRTPYTIGGQLVWRIFGWYLIGPRTERRISQELTDLKRELAEARLELDSKEAA